MVKDAEIRVLRRRRMEGKTQEASEAAAISVRSARKWETRGVPVAAARAARLAYAAGSVWRGVRERGSAVTGG